MNLNIFRRFLPFCLLAVIAVTLPACNKKDSSDDDDEDYASASSVAVTSFSLKANSKIMAHLDSVFFSIDLNEGVIFNADSLPMGTPVDKLIPVIKYASSVSGAEIQMTGGVTEGIVDYKKNPNDTIDFSGRVVLTLTTPNELSKRSYVIKVNVHKSNPDSLMWDKEAVTALPSLSGYPRRQKTTTRGNDVYCMLEESSGNRFTIAVSSRLYANLWTKTAVSLPEDADISTFTATDDAFYLLDRSGALYTATDATGAWTPTGETWTGVTGAYGATLLGIKSHGDATVHCGWPAGKVPEKAVADGFPIRNHSNLVIIGNRWSPMPTAMLCCGRMADGSLSDAAWAFDGKSWTQISQKGLPALEGAVLVPYYSYKTSTAGKVREFNAWLLLGGRDSDGEMYRKAVVSVDNGITWRPGGESLDLPEYLPGFFGASATVASTRLSADLSLAWKDMPSLMPGWKRLAYDIDNYEINWECPYIYVFGGYDSEGLLNNTIWRAVLARLTFAPLF